jgi:hypothetical protein
MRRGHPSAFPATYFFVLKKNTTQQSCVGKTSVHPAFFKKTHGGLRTCKSGMAVRGAYATFADATLHKKTTPPHT